MVLTGVIAFLHNRSGKLPTTTDLAELKKILETPPVNPEIIRKWFQQVFQ